MALTGFDDWELDALKVTYDHIEDLLNEDFSDTGKSEPTSYTMTFTLPKEVHEAMDKYIDENPTGKVELAQLLVNKAKGLSDGNYQKENRRHGARGVQPSRGVDAR